MFFVRSHGIYFSEKMMLGWALLVIHERHNLGLVLELQYHNVLFCFVLGSTEAELYSTASSVCVRSKAKHVTKLCVY